MLISSKIWEFRQQKSNNLNIDDIINEFKVSPVTAGVILNRGLGSIENIKKFLNPGINDFYDPFLIRDMDIAVERIIKAISGKERIIIYGDYDVDGITSTSILFSFLKDFAKNVDFYIPDRLEEGYGLSKYAIDKITAMGVDLIVTVDCGITAVDEVKYIKELGVDIIITDHHECKEVIPAALAVVNPKRKDCSYPFKELAGVGVVFKLVQALASKLGASGVIERFIEIAAMGTVADVVPLIDENRVIVKYGLERIAKTNNFGIRALINVAGLQGKQITSTSIGFILAPRINAAGRVGNARRGVELFLCKEKETAEQIAFELDQDNKARQQTENVILNDAIEMVLNNPEINSQKVLVLASEGWHHGVIGIVSSRITEKFYKPAILISLDGDEGKGSGRSISGFNLFDGLMHCSHLLDKFGGHELAVGLSIFKENIEEFRNEINAFADTVIMEDFQPKVQIDAQISKDDFKLTLANEMKMLEPYGMANPHPIFLYSGLKVVDYKTVGEDKHLKLRVEDSDLYIDAIAFNFGEIAPKIDAFDKIDVACSIEINTWNGQEKMQLNIKDLKTSEEIVFKEKYYSTLENAILSDVKTDAFNKDIVKKVNVLNENVLSIIENGQKNAVLINTLTGARKFVDNLKKAKQAKDKIKVCYNHDLESTGSNNVAIINPHFKNIDLSKYDNVVVYDMCFSKDQYAHLLNKSKNVFIVNDFEDHSNNMGVFEDIIPQRDELIRVYQYIKSKSAGQAIEGDIYSMTREVAVSYNIDINSLKLKKILEVFHEMNLISLDSDADNFKIQIMKQSGAKVNIQESKGLSKLLKIKDEFDYFVKYLKQDQIG